MKVNNLLIILLLFLYCPLYAQEEEDIDVRLSGIVFDSETVTPLQDVTCRLGNVFTTSDRFGRFALNTRVGDTVYFSYIGYKTIHVVIPDTLSQGEYIIALALSPDTVMLSEVIVIHRFQEKERVYTINAKNNMVGARRDAFAPSLEQTQQQNQNRVLNEFASSTNKGHVDVQFGVGFESWRVYKNLRQGDKMRRQTPDLLNVEEMDLIKMIFQFKREDAAKEESSSDRK